MPNPPSRAKRRNPRYADPPKKDDRSVTLSYGQMGEITCPGCGGQTTLKKLGNDAVSELGENRDDIVIAAHRVGGGRYQVRRGDVLCSRAKTKP